MRLLRFSEKSTNNIVAEFPYDFQVKEDLKALQIGFTFDSLKSEPKKWVISTKALHDPESFSKLFDFCTKYQFEVSPEIPDYLDNFHKTVAKNQELAKSTDAEFTVDGFRYPLRNYQKSAANYALNVKRSILALSMRLGKSVSSLAAVTKANAFPCLIVCPANLKYNWKAELQKHILDISEEDICILKGRVDTEDENLKAKYVIINYDILSYREKSLAKIGFKSIIADEFHYCGSPDSKRTKALKSLSKKVEYVIGLTGTPVQNHTKEIASLLDVLGHLSYFGGKQAFISRYCDVTYNGFGYTVENIKDPNKALGILPELNERLAGVCMLRKTRRDVFDEVPLIQDIVVDIEIDSKEYKAAYKLLKAGIPTRDSIFKLKQQIGIGKIDPTRDWIHNWLDQDTGKLVVFAHHVAVQNELLNSFPNAAKIVEGLSAEQKYKEQEKFQKDPNCRLIICSMSIAGEGIQLDAADNVLFVEFGWNPKKMAQAAARIENVTKQSPLARYYLRAVDTIDIILYELLQDKESNSDAIVDRVLDSLIKKLDKNDKNNKSSRPRI